MSPRAIFFVVVLSCVALVAGLSTVWAGAVWLAPAVLTLIGLGVFDLVQTKHAIRRNFPVAGRLRYLFESIRPEMQQYFVESNSSGRPRQAAPRRVGAWASWSSSSATDTASVWHRCGPRRRGSRRLF